MEIGPGLFAEGCLVEDVGWLFGFGCGLGGCGVGHGSVYIFVWTGRSSVGGIVILCHLRRFGVFGFLCECWIEECQGLELSIYVRTVEAQEVDAPKAFWAGLISALWLISERPDLVLTYLPSPFVALHLPLTYISNVKR